MQKDHTHLWVQLCLRTNEWTIFPRAYLSEWVIGKMNLQWTLKADAWVIGYSHCLTNLPHPIPTEILSLWKDTAAIAAKSLQSCQTLCDPIEPAHQAPPSLGFSRQEHWSGLPFPSPMYESEK